MITVNVQCITLVEFFFNKLLQMSLFTYMASSNIFDVMEAIFHSQMLSIDSRCISVGIMNEICYCSAFIKSICLLWTLCNILMYF